MWIFRAVALDLDGTLATRERVADDVLAALDETHEARSLVLVTGRTMEELDRVFPGLAGHFDAVVTENGGVLRCGGHRRVLQDPVDPALDRELADRGVSCRRGEVLLALDGADAAEAAEALAVLGLDHHIVRNRYAAMVLPAGVTKATGLQAALAELGLSVHNTIAVGDAENDLSMLRAAEVGIAVPDAVRGSPRTPTWCCGTATARASLSCCAARCCGDTGGSAPRVGGSASAASTTASRCSCPRRRPAC